MKTLTALALAGSLALGSLGCQADLQTTENRLKEYNAAKYSFDSFGIIESSRWIGAAQGITSGDFDGDGDVDLAVIDSEGDLRIYENKIPQKSDSTQTLY